jgi:hypothetical protein
MHVKAGRFLNTKACAFAFLFLACGATGSLAESSTASSATSAGIFELTGPRLTARFTAGHGSLRVISVRNAAGGATLAPGEAFSLALRDGRVVAASTMKLVAPPVEATVAPRPDASSAAERVEGRSVCADLSSDAGSLSVHWCAILRTGANYLRQEITLHAGSHPVDIAEVRLFDFNWPGAHVVGKVPGSPIVAGDFFFGFEFPLSASNVASNHVTSLLARTLPLEPGQSITYSSVIGVAAPNQMRRDFLAYIEQERAHPYRTFLHYNTWYDIGYGERFNEAQALDRIHAFGEELVRKRGVKMDSFLFDDGWDDTRTLWHFNPGLPIGFSKIHEAAAQSGFGIGVWLSPWGGYSTAKKQRIVAGEASGYETVKGGFALSAPKYYQTLRADLPRHGHQIRRQPVQVRRHWQRQPGLSRQPL